MRSRAAASMLANAGFKKVWSMEGGINAWEGLRAKGEPEAGMIFFPQNASSEELIALCWVLEEGSRKFYAGLPERLGRPEASDLFKKLVTAEEQHKLTLAGLFKEFTGSELDSAFPRSLSREDVMEGGVSVQDALDWVGGRSLKDILEFAVSLEANSYDLYIKMERRLEAETEKKLFSVLSSEEKSHLDRLAVLLENAAG